MGHDQDEAEGNQDESEQIIREGSGKANQQVEGLAGNGQAGAENDGPSGRGWSSVCGRAVA